MTKYNLIIEFETEEPTKLTAEEFLEGSLFYDEEFQGAIIHTQLEKN